MKPRTRDTSPATYAVLKRAGATAATLLLSGVLVPQTHAVMVYGSSDVNYNTTAPSGSLTGSGWQFEGTWGSFLGTPVASSYFITAKHVGGSVGNTFTFQGVSYTTTAYVDSPTSDLRAWKISGSFPTFAPIYTASDELGKGLVVYGRSAARSSTVVYNDVSEAAGWKVGSGGGTQRWGENVVAATVNVGGSLGRMLQVDFDRDGGANEAMLATGDSGGAVFIKDGTTWKLAGINYGITGPYNNAASDTGSYYGAIYDTGGLYERVGSTWGYNLNTSTDLPASWYATRISSNAAWITTTTGVPEPRDWALATGGALLGFALLRRTLRHPSAA